MILSTGRMWRVILVVAGLSAMTAPSYAQAPPPGPPTPTAPGAATARLQTQTSCGRRTFRVVISGRNIRRVTFFVAGRRVRTVAMPPGVRTLAVHLPVRRFGARRQSVRARVTFTNGAMARTLTASATRCARTSEPDFTG